MHPAKCIAYTENGHICGKPAEILDKQRGGMVCRECAARLGLVPSIDALGGKFPDFTGDLSSKDYIRKMREDYVRKIQC